MALRQVAPAALPVPYPFGQALLIAPVRADYGAPMLALCALAAVLALVVLVVDRLRLRDGGETCAAIVRGLFAAVPLVALWPGAAIIARAPSANMASPAADAWAAAVVARTLGTAGGYFIPNVDQLGLGPQLARPGRSGMTPPNVPRVIWILLVAAVVVASVVGAICTLLADRVPCKRGVYWLMLFQIVLWLTAGLAVSFAKTQSLPFEASPLVNHWIKDPAYVRYWSQLAPFPEFNEQRFLENWFVRLNASDHPRARPIQVSTIPNIRSVFCAHFNTLLNASAVAGVPLNTSDSNSAVSDTTASPNGTATSDQTPANASATTTSPTNATAINQTRSPSNATADQRPVVQTRSNRPAASSSAPSLVNASRFSLRQLSRGQHDGVYRTSMSDAVAAETSNRPRQLIRQGPKATTDSPARTSDVAQSSNSSQPRAASGPSSPQLPGNSSAAATNAPTSAMPMSNGSTFEAPERLTSELAGQVLLSYFIGKPVHRDVLQGVGYLALPVMTIAPGFVGQFLHRWYTWPLVLPWLAVVFVLALIGMPALLRGPLAPRGTPQIVQFCVRNYWISVTDRGSEGAWRVDQAVIGLVVVAASLRALAWLWLADVDLDKGVLLEGISEVAMSEGRRSSLSIGSSRLSSRRESSMRRETDLVPESLL